MVCKLQLSCVHGLSACGQPCLNRSLNHYCNTESRPEVGVRGCFTLFPSFQKKAPTFRHAFFSHRSSECWGNQSQCQRLEFLLVFGMSLEDVLSLTHVIFIT